MLSLSDEDLRRLLLDDPRRGWRAFVDQYTPTLLAQVEWAGLTDRDDVLEVYVRVCEHLAENDCARLRRHDPSKGELAAWLTVVVRHAVVDWVRSRTGRRRLFGPVRRLSPFDQRVFQLHYWDRLRPTEIVERLSRRMNRLVPPDDVLDALGRIHRVLSVRHHSKMLSLVARRRPPVSLDEVPDEALAEQTESWPDPELALHVKEIDAAFSDALAALPPEEAAVVRMMFVHGWPRHQIQHALHLDDLTQARVRKILDRLRSMLAEKRIRSAEAIGRRLTFLSRGST